MRKLQLNATELVDTNVSFVSLVKRGANRIPFRIMKEDTQMLDLHKIGRSLFNKAEAKPEIVGAIIQKGIDINKLAEVFKAAGLDPAKFAKSEKDGIVTVAKSDADMTDAMVVKVHKDIGLVVTGLRKMFDGYDFSSTSFGEVMAKGGYCASLGTASEMLRATVGNILAEAGTPDEAATEIQKACEDHKNYVVKLTKGLPASAFRMEADLAKADLAETAVTAAAGDEAPVADATAATVAAVFTDPAAAATAQAAAAGSEEVAKGMSAGESDEDKKKKEMAKEKAMKDAEAAVADGDPTEGKPAADAPATGVDTGPILAAIAELQKSFTDALAGVKGDLQKTAGELTGRIEQVATMAKKTDAALNGTVFSEPGHDPAKVIKTEVASTSIPLLDTAYDRRHAA